MWLHLVTTSKIPSPQMCHAWEIVIDCASAGLQQQRSPTASELLKSCEKFLKGSIWIQEKIQLLNTHYRQINLFEWVWWMWAMQSNKTRKNETEKITRKHFFNGAQQHFCAPLSPLRSFIVSWIAQKGLLKHPNKRSSIYVVMSTNSWSYSFEKVSLTEEETVYIHVRLNEDDGTL